MKPFRSPYRYQGGWAWVAPVITAAAGLIQQRRAKSASVSPQKEAYQSVLGRVEGAKAAGLHPLAALGTPTSSGTPMQMTDFTAVGDQVGAAINSYTQQRQWRAEREFQEAQERSLRSQRINEEMRQQARLNIDAALAKKQGDLIDEQIRASQEESLRRSLAASKPLSVQPRRDASGKIPNQYVPVRDRFGNVQFVPNPDFYDLDLPESVGAATLAIPEVQQNSFFQKIDRWMNNESVLDKARRAYHQWKYPNIE